MVALYFFFADKRNVTDNIWVCKNGAGAALKLYCRLFKMYEKYVFVYAF